MSGEEWSIREFRALNACIVQGSITGGARQLGISQPAVSRAIANLEYKLGITLFERSGKSIIATEEAVRISEDTSPFFSMLDHLRSQSISRHSPMNLTLAAPPNFSLGFVQSVVASFLKTHSNARIELEVCTSPDIINKVSQHKIDLGISDMPIDNHNIIREPFGRSKMACFLHKSHRLAGLKSICAEDLKDENIIGLTKNHPARPKLENLFRKLQVELSVVIETNTSLSALSFVRSGVGIALMNAFPVAKDIDDSIVVLPFESGIEYSPAFILPANQAMKKSTRWFMAHLKEKVLVHEYLD